jgi:PAS domain S-box-containing protein
LRRKTLFSRIVNIGVHHAVDSSERRNIQLTNFLALGIALFIAVIIGVRLSVSSFSSSFYLPILLEALCFVALVLLNYYGFTLLSRILLCWGPAIFLIVDLKILLESVETPETSHYLGFRIFQVAFSMFPFLVFNLSEGWKAALGVSVPVFLAFAFDWMLDLLGVGYSTSGLTEPSYYYNNFRTLVTVGLISAAFIFLKNILERQDAQKAVFIRELKEKNAIIEANAQRELKKVGARLNHHIENTPLAVIERDKDFRIIYWNKRAEELFGWSAKEVMGLRPQDFMGVGSDHSSATGVILKAIEENKDSIFVELLTKTKSGKILNAIWYYSFVRDEHGEPETILSFVSDITEKTRANYFLNERVKELRALYNVSQLLTTSSESSMISVFEQLPKLLPPGWQFPEVCAARLVAFGSIFQTDNFVETRWMQSVPLTVDGRDMGAIIVAYLAEKPAAAEGPFLVEERNLLTAIGQMLQVYVEQKLEEEELHRTQANLTGVINNTEILIWSVDENFNIITYNDASRKYALENFKLDVAVNRTIDNFPEPVRSTWIHRYKRALAGERLLFEDHVSGLDLKYSMSPIVEDGRAIGVVVFVDNITSENQQTRALTEANRKIADLKIMALRSVMNPHFVFNVLSSIQYFITKNDELNAINYLTSFSKLMRNVLTRSVADSVTLKEEIDLLRDYVHLEKLRFDEKFEFVVKCNQDIDTENTRLPSLLIQPFVENAILHGLYNKEGKGILNVNIGMDGDFLVFNVEDDGIGRKASMKIQERNPTKRNSMGTNLTEERLSIINGDNKSPVIYTDLYDREEAAGTRVTIRIRINPN